MISEEYSFEKFLEAVKDKNLPEIQLLASAETGEAERRSSSMTSGIEKAKKIRIVHYKKRVGEFAFFMRMGIKPGGVDDCDFELYEPICKILVEKGQLKPDVLDHFEEMGQG